MRLLLVLFLFLTYLKNQHIEGDFKVDLENGGSFWVEKQKDSLGYVADIKVPVCEDRICYDVKIAFHWNLVGELDRFVISEKEPLTKLDHVLFSKEDYEKLEKILKNKDLNFVKLTPKELVEPNTGPKVDAYSGATNTTIKNEVIEGALFTCYTLWHIVNGVVIDSIKAHTKNALNPSLIQKMMAERKISYYYFLLNELSEKELFDNLDLFLKVIPQSEGYFAKNAFEKFPDYFYETPKIQDFVKNNFLKIDYFSQKALVSKLLLSKDVGGLNAYFLAQFDALNSFNYQSLIQFVLKNPSKVDLESLLKMLENKKIALSPQNYERLLVATKEAGLSSTSVNKY